MLRKKEPERQGDKKPFENMFEARIMLDMDRFKNLSSSHLVETLQHEFRAIQDAALRELKRVQSGKKEKNG